MDGMKNAVLDFWFGPIGSELYGKTRDVWFRKDAVFDAQVRDRFETTIEAALRGDYRDWAATPRGALARVVVLDQFTRNCFRGSPRAIAGDTMALAAAEQTIER